MERSILVSVLVIGVAAAMAGAGTIAYFNDTETSQGNTFTAGTLDLKVDDNDDPYVAHCELTNLKPGDSTIGPGAWAPGALYWTVKNVGSLSGELTVTITNVVNYEKGQNEPEALVDSTSGENEGELGGKLRIQVWRDGIWTYEIGNINAANGAEIIPGFKPSVILNPGEETILQISWCVYSDAGNEIQSDSVEFDVVFHLDQV